MGFPGKSKSRSENWGMGFLLVLFPEDELNDSNTPSSSNSSLFKSAINPLRRTGSNHLLTKAQSTISICALLFFLTLLLFTLSPFEPTPTHYPVPRRFLSSRKDNQVQIANSPSYALQKLGILHSRGTKAMHDLIVGHITDSVTPQDLRIFLRLFHVYGLNLKSDLVLIFPNSHSYNFHEVIFQESECFRKLNVTQFVKLSKKDNELGEPIWGRRSRSNYSEDDPTETTRASYGSVVSFLADELDPENSLAGFLDHVPMSMKRWACYPMLLGRVRRNFKHIMLADVKEVLLLGDPLGRVRTRSPESVQLSCDATVANKHGKKNSAKTELVTQKRVNSGLIMGGARGVRRLANAMLTEIVRATTQHKKKNSVTESGLFNQLVGNEFVLKNANVVMSTESIPDVSSLTRMNNSNSGPSLPLANYYTVVRRGNSNIDVNSMIRKHICSLEGNSLVYSDC